jgi:hypothetical protein
MQYMSTAKQLPSMQTMCQLCKACSSINHFTAFTSHRTTQFIVIYRYSSSSHTIGSMANYCVLWRRSNNHSNCCTMSCARNTVYRWLQSFFTNNMKEKPNRGRKRKLSPSVVSSIVEHTKKIKFITPREIKYFFDLDVCNRTIDRLLIEHNLFGRVARKRHPLMNPKKRLSFAHGNYMSWNFMKFLNVS